LSAIFEGLDQPLNILLVKRGRVQVAAVQAIAAVLWWSNNNL
jgi:hypothetical protein